MQAFSPVSRATVSTSFPPECSMRKEISKRSPCLLHSYMEEKTHSKPVPHLRQRCNMVRRLDFVTERRRSNVLRSHTNLLPFVDP